MANFQNGKIYSIRSHQTEQIYIGSTAQPLHKRFHQHKSLNCISREIMKFDDAYIELVEMCPCANKTELHRREGHYIRTMDCINKLIAGRSRAEYREDNRTKLNQSQRQYNQTHKEEIKQYKQGRSEETKQYLKQYKQTHKKIRKCSCGVEYNDGRTDRRNAHYSSQHHIKFVQDFYERLHSLLVPEDDE